MGSSSEAARASPHPGTPQCMRAPPGASSVVFPPMALSTTDRPPVHHPDAGDPAVGGSVGLGRAREQPVLLERGARVEEELEAVTDEQLALFTELVAVLRVALLDPSAFLEVAVLA